MYFWERRNEIRDRDEKSAGCGILVKKERECGIRTPLPDPVMRTYLDTTCETIFRILENHRLSSELSSMLRNCGASICRYLPSINGNALDHPKLA